MEELQIIRDYFATEPDIQQSEIELKALFLDFLSKIDRNIVIEIGMFYGASAKVWELTGFQEFIGIEYNPKNLNVPLNFPKQHILIEDCTKPSTVEKVRQILNGRKAGFLHIDGCHNYESALRDYNNYSPFIRKGGIIAFHDINLDDNPGIFPVKEVFHLVSKDVPDECKAEIIETHGIGVIIKQED